MLPKSITPCPIVEVIADIRFDPAVPPDALTGIVYQALRSEFPKLEQLPPALIPFEIRTKDPNLKFQPTHKLIGETASILLSPSSTALSKREPYPGWPKLSEDALRIFTAISKTGVITKSTRLGLRYISFFEADALPNLTLNISIASESAIGRQTVLKTLLTAVGCNTLLQVTNHAQLKTVAKKLGTVIDIDAFMQDGPMENAGDFQKFLENAHTAEKALFFKLLKPEFLATLNPAY